MFMVHKRKFKVGSVVKTDAGIVAKVIGSAIYGHGTPYAWVEYRLKAKGKKRTFYRRENKLSKVKE